MSRITKAALTLLATGSMAATLAGVATGPAWAVYPPPRIHLLCINGGTLTGGVCVLPFGVTTAPNAYSEPITVSKAGAAGPTVTFAVTVGSLPPGLTMPAQSGSGTVISGNPTQTGTFTFTMRVTDFTGQQATQQFTLTIQP